MFHSSPPHGCTEHVIVTARRTTEPIVAPSKRIARAPFAAFPARVRIRGRREPLKLDRDGSADGRSLREDFVDIGFQQKSAEIVGNRGERERKS